jgi:hypothetical protein
MLLGKEIPPGEEMNVSTVKEITHACWPALGSVYLKALYVSGCFVACRKECECWLHMHVGSTLFKALTSQ